MPVLSMFFGIIISMYNESGERHNIPHIHCVYSEYEAAVDFYGNILEGELLNHGEKHFRIRPLQ